MHIHHHVSHGLHYSVVAEELSRMELGEAGIDEDGEWDEYEAQYDDETLASNVVAFLHETDTE